MKSYYKLAWKEILGQKVVSVLILIAIVLSTAMTTAVGQAAGNLNAMRRQQAIAIRGNSYASFVQLTEEKAQVLEHDARLSYAGRYIQIGSMELNDILRLDLAEYWGDGLHTRPSYTKLVEGHLPEKPMEIALSEDALQFLGFTGSIGDTISLPLSKALRHGVTIEPYDYQADFVLTGITQNNYLGYLYGSILGFVGEGTAKEILPQKYLYYCMDIRTVNSKNFQEIVDDLIQTLDIHELDTIYNHAYLNALGIHYNASEDGSMIDDEGFPFLILAGVLVTVLVLLAAGLVIYNILKISAARRIGQYGVLRAIGAEKGQLYGIVAAEVLLLCMCGIPAGVLLGFLSSKGILGAVLNQLSPELFLAQDAAQLQTMLAENSSLKWEYLFLSAAIVLLFAFMASAPAAYFAAKVSPVTAIHRITFEKKRRIKNRRKNQKIKKITGFERYYAALNLQRNKSRTIITILSMVMSITVFVTLQSYLSYFGKASVELEHLGDYSVVNEYGGFSPEELERMQSDLNVSTVAAQQFTLYDLDEEYYPVGIETDFSLGIGEKFQIYGYNDCWIDYQFTDQLTDKQRNMLKAGEGCIVRNPISFMVEGIQIGTTQIEEGSIITIAGKKLQVLLALNGYDGYFSVGNNGFINGVQVLVNDHLYSQLTGTNNYVELRPILKEDVNRELFDNTLKSLCGRAAGTTWVSYEETDRQIEESRTQIKLLAWGLILFIGLIGILNIINTIYTNIHTRVVEIGTQRAIGMSAKSLYKTFLWEGVYYGLFAAAIGCVTGYVCTILVNAAGSNTITLTVPPLSAMAEASILSIAACLAATAIPLNKIAKMSIVKSIEAVE